MLLLFVWGNLPPRAHLDALRRPKFSDLLDGDQTPFLIRVYGENETSAFFVQVSLKDPTPSFVARSIRNPLGFDDPFVFIDSPEFKFIDACQGDVPRLCGGTGGCDSGWVV